MNRLCGKIVFIESSDNMSIVELDVQGDRFCSIVLETSQTASYLQIGKQISFLFKETEVAIAKNLQGLISLRNRISSKIKSIEKSKLLTKIILDYKGKEIISIITTSSAQRLGLEVGDVVDWLVKTNEISLLTE